MNFRRKRYKHSREPSGTSDRHDPYQPAPLGLEQLNSLATPEAAVVTRITRGSASESVNELMVNPQDPVFTESGEEIDRANAIITTVRMEHSYC